MMFSPAADRNKHAILDVLQHTLPAQGRALEIASGSGQHIACFAQRLAAWQWQPSDTHAAALDSIAAYVAQAALPNVLPAVLLDVRQAVWFSDQPYFDAIYCANMIHIAPWEASCALLQGSARHLNPGGVLITYGPYREDDVPISPGNLQFDRQLRAENPDWGLRRREDVQAQAHKSGLLLAQRFAMPANNLLLLWRKKPN